MFFKSLGQKEIPGKAKIWDIQQCRLRYWDKNKDLFTRPRAQNQSQDQHGGVEARTQGTVSYCCCNKSPKFIILQFWRSESLKLRCWHDLVTSLGSRGKVHFLVFSSFCEDPCDCIGSTWIIQDSRVLKVRICTSLVGGWGGGRGALFYLPHIDL